MSFSFRYKPIKLASGKIIYKPLIPITFKNIISLDILGMIDSGSDLTIIPEELAEILGINYNSESEVYGISGEPLKSRIGVILVKFGKGNEFYEFKIPVIVPTKKQDIPVIIGRIGFFDQFKVTFIESEKRVEFKRYKKLYY